MLFDIISGNGMGDNILKSGDRQATFRQTPQEHEELLDERTIPGYQEALMLPGPQRIAALQRMKALAELREQESPKYWLDEYPRRPISQSSSWVSDINYDPETQMAQIQLGNKVYGYSMSPNRIAQLLNSPSIGKELNNA